MSLQFSHPPSSLVMFQFRQLLRPQSALRAASSFSQKPASVLPRFQTRALHRLPQLTNDEYLKANGIPGLLSKESFHKSWTEYQGFLINKLNALTQGSLDANATIAELLIRYARQPDMAFLFNFASMAHNNHFFFDCLAPGPVKMTHDFAKDINDTCSSIESLRLDFLATAESMFGPGYVWLAKNLETEGLLHIFCTYNAGSPYPAAHSRRQPVDMATHTPETAMGNQYAGFMGAHSANQKNLAPGAVNVHPILCVNTWEHVWMFDYGVNGKAEYLEKWWDSINWGVVEHNYNSVSATSQSKGPRGFDNKA